MTTILLTPAKGWGALLAPRAHWTLLEPSAPVNYNIKTSILKWKNMKLENIGIVILNHMKIKKTLIIS